MASRGVFRTGMLSALGIALLVTLILPRPLQAAPGDLDPSFGSGGIVITDFGGNDTAFALALQPDGKIVAAGTSSGGGTGTNFALARHNPDGSPDASFGARGTVITDFISNGSDEVHALAIQPDGKIVVAGFVSQGFDFALARFGQDGSLDPTFGTGGKVISQSTSYGSLWAVALQPDGKIVVAGESNSRVALARYNPDGSLDATFGGGGTVIGVGDGRANAIALQPDGKIVVAGDSRSYYVDFADQLRTIKRFALARYNPDGSPDATFGLGGRSTTGFGGDDIAFALALQPDGKIIVAGESNSRVALARYNSDGNLDATFGGGGTVITDFGGGE